MVAKVIDRVDEPAAQKVTPRPVDEGAGELVGVLLDDEPRQFLATIQIGITLAGFLASAAAAVSLAEPLEEPLSFLGGAAGPVSIIVVTLVLSYLTLVFGELAPKRVAMQRAERWGMLMARPTAFLATLTRPIVWLLSVSTNFVVRLAGGDPSMQREEVTEEELRDMVAVQPTFTADQRQLIDGAFDLTGTTPCADLDGPVLRANGAAFPGAVFD